MREFFKGWRRKAGVVTLAMACLFLGLWFRSKWFVDDLSICTSRTTMEALLSLNGHLCLVSTRDSRGFADEPFIHWRGVPYHRDTFVDPNNSGYGSWQYWGLGIATAHSQETWATESLRCISYWYFVTPLTLLSAYLILWPGKRVTKQVANSEGA